MTGVYCIKINHFICRHFNSFLLIWMILSLFLIMLVGLTTLCWIDVTIYDCLFTDHNRNNISFWKSNIKWERIFMYLLCYVGAHILFLHLNFENFLTWKNTDLQNAYSVYINTTASLLAIFYQCHDVEKFFSFRINST